MTEAEPMDGKVTAPIPTFHAQRRMVTGWFGQRYEALTFRCPTCGKVNVHSTENGHRVSHCGCWPKGYYIQGE